jgi:amino acid adenylation domain-containing protein/thioester reductase-like protein
MDPPPHLAHLTQAPPLALPALAGGGGRRRRLGFAALETLVRGAWAGVVERYGAAEIGTALVFTRGRRVPTGRRPPATRRRPPATLAVRVELTAGQLRFSLRADARIVAPPTAARMLLALRAALAAPAAQTAGSPSAPVTPSARAARPGLDSLSAAGRRRSAPPAYAMPSAPAAPPGLDVLSAAERHQALVEWNDSRDDDDGAGDLEPGALLPGLLAARAASQPQAVALVAGEEEVSYGRLEAWAEQLASRLRERGAGPEGVVGMLLERSPAAVAALMAIWKSGAAYLPLDPESPPERLAFLLRDAWRAPGPRLVVTRGGLAERIAEPGVEVLLADEPGAGVRAASRASGRPRPAPRPLLPDHAAYVIYTSGSTGAPKGIVVSHRSLARRIRWASAAELAPGDVVLHKTTLSFDVSLVEIFAPLLAGCRCVLAGPDGHRDPLYLAGLIARRGITYASFPPSTLALLLDLPAAPRQLASLRTLVTGGETVAPELAQRAQALLPAVLYNRYGPTETTISVLTGACRQAGAEPTVPLGRPIAGARVYVLDEQLRPRPPLVAGEIYIGGPCVSRGYLGRPGLTADRFVPDPFSAAGGERLYRTGDRARWRWDGTIEFLGRGDRQVKVRGFRVELEEVEVALHAHPAVREAVVVAPPEAATGSRRLVAYLVAEPGAALDAGEVRRFLGRRLAAHMIPAAFVQLPALPRTLSGKVDAALLPPAAAVGAAPVSPAGGTPASSPAGEPSASSAGDPHASPAAGVKPASTADRHAWVAAGESPAPSTGEPAASSPGEPVAPSAGVPRTALERTLAALFAELLELPRVGRQESLFELGGHSLLLVRLQTRLRGALGLELELSEIARHPSVAGLAALAAGVARAGRAGIRRARTSSARISPKRGGESFAARFAADAVLEPALRWTAGAPSLPPRIVLLTGATGFLGAHLAAELLAQTPARVLCLVRAAGAAAGRAALRCALERYGLWREDAASRLEPLAGDLARPRLGLAKADLRRLDETADAIYHCGAQVNFLYPYEALRAANVEGTRELLRLAAAGRAKALHHVSTLAVLPRPRRHGLALPEAPLGKEPAGLATGYDQSKWVAERLVEAARRRGAPVTIYRPGWIVASSRTGIGNPADLLTRLAVASLRAGVAPELGALRVCPTPVDFAAAAIAFLSMRGESPGGIFHLVNPRPVAVGRLRRWSAELGHPLSTRPVRVWARTLAEQAESDAAAPLSPFADLLRRLAGDAAADRPGRFEPPRFGSVHTLSALAAGPVACPAVDRRFVAAWLGALAAAGLLHAPAARDPRSAKRRPAAG